MTIQFKSGQILFTGSSIAMDPNCCCGGGGSPTPCPADCATCPETFLATLTGMTGLYTPPTPDVACSNANGAYTLTRTFPDACEWSSQTSGPSGWLITLYCYDNAWYLSLVNYDLYNLEFFRWTQPHTSACPPSTGWTPTSCDGCPCTAGSVVIS